MKKHYLVLVLVLLNILPFASYAAIPAIIDDETDLYLNYGEYHHFDLVVIGLVHNENYTVMVANNTQDSYNLTFTAISTKAKIQITYDGLLFDIRNKSLTQLKIIFVEGTSIIHFIKYIDLKIYVGNDAITWLIDKAIFAFLVFLSGIVGLVIVKNFL